MNRTSICVIIFINKNFHVVKQSVFSIKLFNNNNNNKAEKRAVQVIPRKNCTSVNTSTENLYLSLCVCMSLLVTLSDTLLHSPLMAICLSVCMYVCHIYLTTSLSYCSSLPSLNVLVCVCVCKYDYVLYILATFIFHLTVFHGYI